jgi:hypothetical protein
MTAYLQMGHDTQNLVGAQDLDAFGGIVLSPVNRKPESLVRDLQFFRRQGDFDIVLDPQLYFPTSRRGMLPHQPYYPDDLDTADFSSVGWWNSTVNRLGDFAITLGVDAVTSPVVQPRTWNDDYFARCARISNNLMQYLHESGIRILTTVMVDIDYTVDREALLRMVSILSGENSSGYYLVIVTDVDPRREISDPDELVGIMSLIRELEDTGRPVLVSHCSSDMILLKAAGASHCASGKFFNLRRYTESRFAEPAGGGGQLPYWFEHSLLAFLRGADVLRLLESEFSNLVGTLYSGNYWASQILDNFRAASPTPWLALGWKQYLSWFCRTEQALQTGDPTALVRDWLRTAEVNWRELDDNDILFDETRNDGTWIRRWRQALVRLSHR